MKIAIVMARASPWSVELALGLTHRGHQVHVIDFARTRVGGGYLTADREFLRSQMEDLDRGVARVHLLPTRRRGLLRYLFGARTFRRLMRMVRPDVVLSLGAGGHAVLVRLAGIRPHVTYAVGSDVLLGSRLKRNLVRTTLESADGVAVNGGYLHDQLRALAPAARSKTIRLGVDLDRYSRPELPGEPPVTFLCSRGFQPIYNNEAVVRAATLMPETGTKARFVFVSSGETLEAARGVARRADPARAAGIVFHGGVEAETMLRELRSAHVYVSMSRSDGTSASTLEALSCGLFPVLSDIPQNREWIDPTSRHGSLVPLDDERALVEALQAAMNDREMRTQAAVFNRDLVRERASKKTGLDLLSAMLEEVTRPTSGDA